MSDFTPFKRDILVPVTRIGVRKRLRLNPQTFFRPLLPRRRARVNSHEKERTHSLTPSRRLPLTPLRISPQGVGGEGASRSRCRNTGENGGRGLSVGVSQAEQESERETDEHEGLGTFVTSWGIAASHRRIQTLASLFGSICQLPGPVTPTVAVRHSPERHCPEMREDGRIPDVTRDPISMMFVSFPAPRTSIRHSPGRPIWERDGSSEQRSGTPESDFEARQFPITEGGPFLSPWRVPAAPDVVSEGMLFPSIAAGVEELMASQGTVAGMEEGDPRHTVEDQQLTINERGWRRDAGRELEWVSGYANADDTVTGSPEQDKENQGPAAIENEAFAGGACL